MNKDLLKIDRVSKQYRAGKLIFENITRDFKPGEGVLLSGPNGSGKTTFLKLLSINTFPTSGSVMYGDINIHKHPWRYLKNVGLVHDEESLPHYLSATELLEWVVRSRGGEEDASRQAGELLDYLELDEARNEQIGTYSTGMKKKVQIAAALITSPAVLILDEPLRGLDQSATGKVLELLRQALQKGAILLMASHARESDMPLFSSVLKFPLK